MAIVRVAALKDFRTNALSTSYVSTGYNLGPLTAAQRLVGFFHLTCSSTGRTLVATIQDSSSSGFTTLSTAFTFGLSSEIGSTWPAPVAMSTDRQWFRATWTMSTAASTGGSWKGLMGMGIQ